MVLVAPMSVMYWPWLALDRPSLVIKGWILQHMHIFLLVEDEKKDLIRKENCNFSTFRESKLMSSYIKIFSAQLLEH